MALAAETKGIRQVGGTTLPAAGDWVIDASHSHVGFTVRHVMVSKVRGSFGTFSGTIHVAEQPQESSVEVTIDLASIDTRDEGRDAHLRSPDFFDVEQFPQATFRSTKVTGDGAAWKVDGELTIRGVTRPVALEGEYLGSNKSPYGFQVAGFSAKTKINRKDYGLNWNAALETGGVLVGDEVKISLDLELVLQAA